MYYRLKDQFRLRGWERLETGIADHSSGQVFFLQPGYYKLLLMCNGSWDFDGVMFSDADRMILAGLEKSGFLEASQNPLPPPDPGQNYRKYDNRMIRDAHWSITGSCNYSCRHCYMSAPHGKLPVMSRAQCEDTVRQMAQCGVQTVSLTGGEALTHPDFWYIADLLLENEIRLRAVYSNGFLVNERFFQECAKRNIKPQLSLSFDGLGGAHEWLRNTKGADSHIDRALHLAQENGFPVDIEFCLYRKSASALRESMRYLQKLGVTSIKINQLSLTGEGTSLSDEAISREEMYRMLLNYIPEYKEDGLTMTILWGGVYFRPEGISFIYNADLKEEQAENYCLCGHARNSMYITSQGHILPCIPYSENPEVTGEFETLFDVPLKELLSDSMYFKVINLTLSEYLKKNPECSSCADKYNCAGGCRGRALSNQDVWPEGSSCTACGSSGCGTSEGTNHFLPDREACYFFKSGIKKKIEAVAAKTFS